MYRLLYPALAAVLAATMLYVPGAGALEAEPTPTEPDREATDAVREVDTRPARPKLRCRGAIGFGGQPKVKCRWTESEHPAAAAYKLVRVGGDGREVVFRTDDTSVTRFTDKDVEFNTRYRYRLVVLDETGERVQRSRWNRAYVRRPNVEVLHLKCAAVDVAIDDRVTDLRPIADTKPVGCKWEAARSDRAVAYELWRLLPGSHREHVATVRAGAPLRHIDHVPADVAKAKYAVLAVDDNGKIVGRSRVSVVHWRTDG